MVGTNHQNVRSLVKLKEKDIIISLMNFQTFFKFFILYSHSVIYLLYFCVALTDGILLLFQRTKDTCFLVVGLFLFLPCFLLFSTMSTELQTFKYLNTNHKPCAKAMSVFMAQNNNKSAISISFTCNLISVILLSLNFMFKVKQLDIRC